MDFIVKFPVLEEFIMGFKADFIMIIMDRLIKDMIFIPFMEKADIEELVYVFLKWIMAEYSLPEELIID